MKYIIAFSLLIFSVSAYSAEEFLTINMKQNTTLYLYTTKCLIDKYNTGGHAELVNSSGRVLIACWFPSEATETIKVLYEDGDYYQYPMDTLNIHN